jgi:hypothetical protein
MTSNRIVVTVAWGPRQEGLEECSRRLCNWLDTLRAVHPAFERWKRTGPTKREAQRKGLLSTPDDILNLLRSGAQRRDSDGTQIQNLGFSFDLWNEFLHGAFVKIHGTCGTYSKVGILNRVYLRLPTQLKGCEELSLGPILKLLLKNMVTSWNPESGCVFSDALLNAAFPNTLGVEAGWITYARLENQLRLEPGFVAHLEQIGSVGVIVDLLGGRRPSVVQEVVDAVRKVREIIQKEKGQAKVLPI